MEMWGKQTGVTLPPINMEPDRGVLEDHFPFKGTPLSGFMLVDAHIHPLDFHPGVHVGFSFGASGCNAWSMLERVGQKAQSD